MAMTKADIVESLYEKVGFSKKDAADLVEVTIEVLPPILDARDAPGEFSPGKQTEAARIISARGLSVRQTEALVRRLQLDPTSKPSQAFDPDIRVLQTDLSEKIGAPVTIQHGAKGKGKLVIRYGSLDELDGILEHIR